MHPRHRRKPVRRGRPHHQFTVAMAIMALVMAGGMAAGAVTSVAVPDGGGAVEELTVDGQP